MKIENIETQHYSQDQDAIDWFNFDGQVWGISKRDDEFRLIDCDGYPVEMPTQEQQATIYVMLNASNYFTE